MTPLAVAPAVDNSAKFATPYENGNSSIRQQVTLKVSLSFVEFNEVLSAVDKKFVHPTDGRRKYSLRYQEASAVDE